MRLRILFSSSLVFFLLADPSAPSLSLPCPFSQPSFAAQLSELRARWRKSCRALYDELLAVGASGLESDAKLVDELLLRLDFNGFFNRM